MLCVWVLWRYVMRLYVTGVGEEADLGNDASAVTVSFIHHVSFPYPNPSASAIPVSPKLREEPSFIFLSVVMQR